MAKLTKKIRRAISIDESIRRYFHMHERDLHERLLRRHRLARIEQERPDGTVLVLQIIDIHPSEHGTLVRVR